MDVNQFLLIAGIHLLAVMSPGPDFIMISRNALLYSRKAGVFTAVGLGLGILVHVTYSMVGIGFLIANSILLFTIIKFLGAAYLIYLGYKCLRAKPTIADSDTPAKAAQDLSKLQALRIGFLTNLLNPKATLFFFALFTQVIRPDTPLYVQALYGIEMAIATFLWFALVAAALSHRRVTTVFQKIQHHVERVFGVILVALGVRVAFSSPS